MLLALRSLYEASGPEEHTLEPAGFANAQAFGTHSLNATLAAAGFENQQLFSTHSLNATLAPQGFANVTEFGQARLILPVVLEPAGFENAQEFGTHSLNATLAVVGFENQQLFGGLGDIDTRYTLEIAGFENTQEFGTQSVNATLAAEGFENTQQFGLTFINTNFTPPVEAPQEHPMVSSWPSAAKYKVERPKPYLLEAVGHENVSFFGRATLSSKHRKRRVREDELLMLEAA